ncbi:MAG TPA: pyridoxal-phosphate dependent enzyme [Gemmatimonadaceae bacterium]|nr:pyridoxal-phosphate dependent enzyme [Gemmatimonadaceae bacterium]
MSTLPLIARFPALARIPRAELGSFPTPVERVDLRDVALAGELWIKRDDLTASPLGGNKVRALEFLLGGLAPGEVVLTAGGEGSTHILTTATYVRALGGVTHAVRWTHEMNPSARDVADRARAISASVTTVRNSVLGLLRAHAARRARIRWIPPGGTSELGMLGHVNAALELAEQIARGEMPSPARVVLPVGSGGTAAGLALGFAIAGVDTVVVGARVAPRIAAGSMRVLTLAKREQRYLERLTGERLPRVDRGRVEIVHSVYAGGYGRALPGADREAAMLQRVTGLSLDGTYSAKAFSAACSVASREPGTTLFWLTFDGRRE